MSLGMIARAHAPRTWARASSPCSLHGRMNAQCIGIIQCFRRLPSACMLSALNVCTTMQGVHPNGARHAPYSPHGHGLSCLNLVCLGQSSALEPTFTSNRLGHLIRAQHSPENFTWIVSIVKSLCYL